ncbi:hypothetical protein ABZ807_09395 [Micromonospora sp. NPDC047548]|uniref:hypothetical protein n=1 Tax=Micromonospora sp. NPDC047548 TaxID=3155624 RepID=UPI0033CA2875
MTYPTEQCRTCQAPIIWAVTDRDKDMPVDAQPSDKGNVALSVDDKGRVRARVVPAHLAFGRKDLRLSHFVGCPDAPKWRRR